MTMLALMAFGTLLSSVPACPGGSPPLVQPTLLVPFEVVQGPLAVANDLDYAGGVRLHLLFNPRPDSPLRLGPTIAAETFGGVRNVGAGGRVEARVLSTSLAALWAGGEYIAPLAGTRSYGGTLGAELARAVRVTVRVHRVPGADAWLYEAGAGFDLRYLVARSGYVPPPVPERVVTTPATPSTIFDLVRSESASASATLALPDSGALRDAVGRQLDGMRRQRDRDALRTFLTNAGLPRVAQWMDTAVQRAVDDAAANRPPVAVPAWDGTTSRQLVQALVAGVATNVCRTG